MFFNIKSTAVFTLLYALLSTVGIEPAMVDQYENSGCDGSMPFHPRMLVPATFTAEYSIPTGLVLGIIALVVILKFTPDFWSYRRAGITLWLGMTALIPALVYAFDFADPSVRLYVFILNTVTTAICLGVMTATLKRRRLSKAIAARLARQKSDAQSDQPFDRTIVNMPRSISTTQAVTEQGVV